MNRKLTLSEEEWRIVAEILEAERQELHPVIHHAGRMAHEALHDRLRLIERLLERMNVPARSN